MPVHGVGGFFLRAQDPDALAAWYHEHLGVGGGLAAEGLEPVDAWSWTAHGGPLVFAPFPASTDHWPAGQQVMLNLRVSDLDALLAELAGKGVPAVTKPEWDSPEAGRFAHVVDPEGNELELWEPPGRQPEA